ncbi:hypothetical protein R9C05_01725 [Metamycoplasma subdolum]|nr:hypothetical protein [Metamycoplasma subdolum]WPB50308.1 hypothetical protein R9C05_01725 [Metamycoplasma subdolum]
MTLKWASIKWNLSERSIRNYCSLVKIKNATLVNGSWIILYDSKKTVKRNKKNYLLEKLRFEKKHLIKNGIDHKFQIDMIFNSNHMEVNELSHEETIFIFETRLVGFENKINKVDDILEIINHFNAIDRVIGFCNCELSESFIKELHKILKSGIAQSKIPIFSIGNYKREPNTVGNIETVHPKLVNEDMKKLLENTLKRINIHLKKLLNFMFVLWKFIPFKIGTKDWGGSLQLKNV